MIAKIFYLLSGLWPVDRVDNDKVVINMMLNVNKSNRKGMWYLQNDAIDFEINFTHREFDWSYLCSQNWMNEQRTEIIEQFTVLLNVAQCRAWFSLHFTSLCPSSTMAFNESREIIFNANAWHTGYTLYYY